MPVSQTSTFRNVALAVLTTACGALGCAGSSASAPQAVTLNVALKSAHYRLANGLEVVLHEDRTLRNVVVNVRYHVGSKDDPPGRSGFAHLYEHLMFLGSRKITTETGFSQALNNAGVLKYNAGTRRDSTDYYEVMPPAALPIALWLEADRMATPLERLTEASFKRERDVVKNEWRQNYDNEPLGHVPSFVQAAVFPEGHPYHRSTIGSPEDLDRSSIDEARSFGAKFYAPNNATLVVAGDLDVEDTKKRIDDYFAAIPSGESVAARSFPYPRLTADRQVVVEADVERPRVIFAWPLPPPYTPGWDETYFAAGRLTGMTSWKLTTDTKVARSVNWGLAPGRLGSLLTITVELESGQKPEAAIAALETRVNWLSSSERVEYVWHDLADSRTSRMTNSVLDLASISGRAETLQDYTEYFGEPDSAQVDLRRIQAVRASDGIAATKAFLANAKIIVTVVPTRNAPRAGRIAR